MRSPRIHIAFLVALSFALAMSLCSEQLPRITGETLSGRQVSLPSVSAGSAAIVCIGFSHASQSQLKSWADRTSEAFGQNGRVHVYLVAVLEDARLVRGMAVHGMRSRVPAQQQDHFVVVYEGERELKRIAGFRRSEDAYILLLDPRGEIQWVNHGPASDAALQELTDHVHSIQRSE